jgi:S-adenosylmethionine uptake transporter
MPSSEASAASTDYFISFLSGVLSALAYFSVRKMKSVPGNTIILSLSASGVLLALLSSLFIAPLRVPDEPAVVALLCLSSLPAIAAQYLMTWSFQSGEAGFVALGQYSGPVFAALLGIVAFGEMLSSWQWLGACIAILFGVMMPLVDERTLQARIMSRPRRAVQVLKERMRAP